MLALVEASEIELTPLEIAKRTKINHSTVRGYCCQLLKENKIFQPYKGAYCSKITHGMIFSPLRVHNLILCLDQKTECLVRGKGWLGFNGVFEGDEVAVFDLNKRGWLWGVVRKKHVYEYDGDMVTVDKKSVSFAVTPNHRMVIDRGRRIKTKHNYSNVPFEFVRADCLRKEYKILATANFVGESNEIRYASWNDDFLRLLGWTIGDGHYPKGKRTGRGIIFNLSANSANELEPVLKRLGYSYSRRDFVEYRNGTRCQKGYIYLFAEHGKKIREIIPEKRLVPRFLEMPIAKLRMLYEGLIASDGREGFHQEFFFQNVTERDSINIFQAICLKLGKRCIISECAIKHNELIACVNNRQMVGLWSQGNKGCDVQHQHYNGKVWCLTVDSGAFIARRNGRMFVTGNSVDAPWLDFSDDLTEFVGQVKVRVQFGLERRRLTGRISCDSGMDRNAVIFALNHCYDLMRQRTGHPVENVVVKTFEVNRDYQGVRIDGVKCYTVKGLFDVLERIYQKEDSVVRTEYKVTKDMTIDEFQVLMQGGVTGYNLQQAMFALAQEVRAQKEAQKFTNEKLGQVANLLQALLNKILKG